MQETEKRTAYTPGPWKFRYVWDTDGQHTIAVHLETLAPNPPLNDPVILSIREDWIRTFTNGTDEDEANARLIAAAPELVEALRAMTNAAQTILASNWARGIAGDATEAEGDALASLDESCEDVGALLARIDQ